MDVRKKIDRINPPEDEKLQDKITNIVGNEDEIEAMQKDFHLLQAALATDQTIISLDETIISLDETIRELFKRASQQVGEIRDIIWVNPDRADEQSIAWLQNGALPETHRRLSA